MKAVVSFEDLEVFKRAYGLSLEIHRMSQEFPQAEQYEMARQIRRASKSVCANIAEGFGKQRQSRAEFRRFLMMAMGSADEMQLWSRYCGDLELVDGGVARQWRAAYKEIARMLHGLMRPPVE